MSGILTIIGSLAPASWRTEALSDLSGGFGPAQYILGDGTLIVGLRAALYVKYCT